MRKSVLRKICVISALILTMLMNTACPSAPEESKVSGSIKIDGSSTVGPISQAVAEEFALENKGVEIGVGISGTGGGFNKLTSGEIDINDASRTVKDSELEKAKENGIEMTELEVAYDGIAIVVNKENDWVDDITLDDLKKMWSVDSVAKTWKDIRPDWPDEPLKLYGPGSDSGTFEYFTEKVNGKAMSCRSDFTASEDDNVLVMGVAGDKGSLGYFGIAYANENADKVKILKVSGKDPSYENVLNKSYELSRPLYIYVNNKSLERPEVMTFVKYYLQTAKDIVESVGYFPMENERYDAQLEKIGQ